MGSFRKSTINPPFVRAQKGLQSDAVTVTATDTQGLGGAFIPAEASIVAITSTDSADYVYLPLNYVAGTEILISVGDTGCELRAIPSNPYEVFINGTKAANQGSHATQLALSAFGLYRCVANGVNTGADPQQLMWTITLINANGSTATGGTPN
jgi:hypothetical protein